MIIIVILNLLAVLVTCYGVIEILWTPLAVRPIVRFLLGLALLIWTNHVLGDL